MVLTSQLGHLESPVMFCMESVKLVLLHVLMLRQAKDDAGAPARKCWPKIWSPSFVSGASVHSHAKDRPIS